MREVAWRAGGRNAFGEPRIFFAPAQDSDRSPRRDDERDRQRPAHRRACADRDRPHVWPHQSADERHRQHRRDDGEGGENGRVADFAHRFDRDG